jgi:hypothetical protein
MASPTSSRSRQQWALHTLLILAALRASGGSVRAEVFQLLREKLAVCTNGTVGHAWSEENYDMPAHLGTFPPLPWSAAHIARAIHGSPHGERSNCNRQQCMKILVVGAVCA